MSALTPAQEVLAKAMSEKQLLALVVDAAVKFGWLVFHPWTSIHSASGWPDLVLVKSTERRFWALELKREGKVPTPAQMVWLEALASIPGVSVAVVRPRDWLSGEVEEQLMGGNGSE